MLAAVYVDGLSQRLTEADPPFDPPGVLADELDLPLAGHRQVL